MNPHDKKEIKNIVDEAAKSYFPITRINFSQILQALILMGVVWVIKISNENEQNNAEARIEIRELSRRVDEISSDLNTLEQSLYNNYRRKDDQEH